MHVTIKNYAPSTFIGQRHTARPIRNLIIEELGRNQKVVIDFSGVKVTQSFTDELIGALVLTKGPAVMSLLSFTGCSDAMKKIITFVVRDRAHQYEQRKSSPNATWVGPEPTSSREEMAHN